MESIAVIAFTKAGTQLACQLRDALCEQGMRVRVAAPERFASAAGAEAYPSLEAWTSKAFAESDALLFVSSAGIAVRAIATHVRDKFQDPAVVSVDEKALFAVPLLSGHVGGANDLARLVAKACGAQAVISTATDVNGLFAVDEWARKHSLTLLDRNVAKRVSAALLEGAAIGFTSDFPVKGALPCGLVAVEGGGAGSSCPEIGVSISLDPNKRPFEHTLRLAPCVVTVGVGCKRNTSASTIASLIDTCLEEAHIAPQAVCTLASINVKQDEAGLREVANTRSWDLRFYSAEQLAAVPGSFASSAFVEATVGVDNVCERAACASGAQLALGRHSRDGATVALAIDHEALASLSFTDDATSNAADNTTSGTTGETASNTD